MSRYTLDSVEFIAEGLDDLVDDGQDVAQLLREMDNAEAAEAVAKLVALADIIAQFIEPEPLVPNWVVDARVQQFRDIGVIK